MEGFMPIPAAAAAAGYSPTMVRHLVRDKRVATRPFYGRTLVNLADVIAYQETQTALGAAKHTPRKFRPGGIISQEIIPQEVPDA